MDSTTTTESCARCGKTVAGYSTRDGKGNTYCQACIQRLSGSDAPARGTSHTCALCGTMFQNAVGSVKPEGKGNYCPDCLGRLHGRKSLRRYAATQVAPLNRDAAFDQMIDEIFDDRPPFAMAG